MKIIIVLLAFVAFAAAVGEKIQPFAVSIGDQVKKVIEEKRDQMPCGFPSMGVPVLAPFVLKHQSIAFDSAFLNVTGSVDDFTLWGLNDFEVEKMTINPLTNKATFRFRFANINVDTHYNLNVLLNKVGITVNLKGSGPAKFALKDIEINGVMKFAYLTQLKVKSLDIRTHIGGVNSDIKGILGEGALNSRLNEILAESVEAGINENADYFAEQIEENIVPRANNFLADKKISDLVGSGGSGAEKVPCNPA